MPLNHCTEENNGFPTWSCQGGLFCRVKADQDQTGLLKDPHNFLYAFIYPVFFPTGKKIYNNCIIHFKNEKKHTFLPEKEAVIGEKGAMGTCRCICKLVLRAITAVIMTYIHSQVIKNLHKSCSAYNVTEPEIGFL